MMIEISYWNSIKDSDDISLFETYLKRYPKGQFADIARHKISRAKDTSEPDSLDELIRNAESAFKKGELDEARELWEQVRNRQPENINAERGLERIVTAYLEKAKRAIDRERFSDAQLYINKAERLDLLSRKVKKVKKKLEKERRVKDKGEAIDKVPPPSF